jgi:hypothetical protein
MGKFFEMSDDIGKARKWCCGSVAGLPDFCRCNIPKQQNECTYVITIKGLKIYHKRGIVFSKALKIFPSWYFWNAKIPSGIPGVDVMITIF